VSALDSAWVLHVQAHPVKLELLLCRDGIPVAATATAMPTDAAAAATIIRSLHGRLAAGCPSTWKAENSHCVIHISGSLAPAIAGQLQMLALPVELGLLDDRTPRALAVADSIVTSARRLDFLQPRCTDGRSARWRRQGSRTAAVALAAAVAGGATLWQSQQELDVQFAQLQQDSRQLQEYVDRGRSVVDKWSYVNRWQQETIHGAREIREFAALLPPRDRMIVTRLQLENAVDAGAAILRIDGLAEEPEDVLNLNASLLQQPSRYELHPQGIEPAPEGSDFPNQFRLEAGLLPGRLQQETTP
jgi:hypothetical protein